MTARKRDIDRKAQAGFTLIELIAVIVILGLLAVVAVPRYIDLQDEAAAAAAQGVAGGLASAFALNFAACAAGNAGCVAVTNCTDGGGLLQGGLPANYVITAGDIAVDTPATCTVTGPTPQSATATFTGIRFN
ncbi:MAG: prepilin-type N-terminal cleavage/methylation domain-containing protein [Desulfocurvibacter africanus]